MNPVHRQQVRAHACAPPCLNLHALGEQWIGEVSDVDIVQSPQEDNHEGDQLIFKAHIRGWETDVRQARCQYLKGKSDLGRSPQSWWNATLHSGKKHQSSEGVCGAKPNDFFYFFYFFP